MPLPRLALRVLVLVLSAAGIASCSESLPTEAELEVDSVRIVSIQPALGANLQAGSLLTVSATLDYRLTRASAGTISMVFEDQTYAVLSSTPPSPEAPVTRGSGTVTLSGQIVVPASGVSMVHVFFPLFHTGAKSSQTLDDIYYRVSQGS